MYQYHFLSWPFKSTYLKNYQLHVLYIFSSSKSDIIWSFSVDCKEVEEQRCCARIWMDKELKIDKENGMRLLNFLLMHFCVFNE